MSWKKNVKNWDGKLYKVLQGNKSCHGGDFEWSLPKDGNPGDWTPIIEDIEVCKKGYHLTTHYARWSNKENISVYEAEGNVIEFDGRNKVICSRARLLKLIENPFPENNFGINNSGNYNSGSYNSGDWNSGHFNSGNYNYGNFNFGSHNYGNWNFGYGNSGNYNTGYFNSGNWNSGWFNSGNWNSGWFNSGNWNSGNMNFGYFCTIHKSDKIFNKFIPEDWKLKFPDWIYFDLLSEGYSASWQKTFENASIEGIKELLALPNFDYDIFEEISSISKEQIEEKLDKTI